MGNQSHEELDGKDSRERENSRENVDKRINININNDQLSKN